MYFMNLFLSGYMILGRSIRKERFYIFMHCSLISVASEQPFMYMYHLLKLNWVSTCCTATNECHMEKLSSSLIDCCLPSCSFLRNCWLTNSTQQTPSRPLNTNTWVGSQVVIGLSGHVIYQVLMKQSCFNEACHCRGFHSS